MADSDSLQIAAANYKQACEDTKNLTAKATIAQKEWMRLQLLVDCAKEREVKMREELLTESARG